MEPFWNTHTIPQGETRHWELGPLEFWVQNLLGEWRVAFRRAEDESQDLRWTLGEPADFPGDVDFQRFTFDSSKEENQLTLQAELPDRSIVSRPRTNIQIPPGGRAHFVCGIPLSVRLLAGSAEKPKSLTAIPVRDLSRTWFGSPMEGEACYAASTLAVRDFQQLAPYGFRMLCPVEIKNRTSEPLPFERICLRVRHLALYRGKKYLWSSEAEIKKASLREASEVTFRSGAPTQEPEAQLVNPARERPESNSLLLRTFSNFRHFIEFH